MMEEWFGMALRIFIIVTFIKNVSFKDSIMYILLNLFRISINVDVMATKCDSNQELILKSKKIVCKV